ncbi:TonB-dependent receptor [Flagellimonas sp. HMM57]|uniref:outer membrane beta-barrel family protein n=1 Tax=unclassified Flagellimonas TaxID=2644544 RepID=UPI0013D5D09F|nr:MULTISPECIES: outer membrane beta-barrel family protein [unclassified Flagellimonas]UII76849.1 TonB-dependent receptor [Flagellimonas sp. HMM57]
MKHLYFLIFCFSISAIFGQDQFSLQGNVVDEHGNQVAVGDVLVYDESQENLIQYTQLYDGRFTFNTILGNSYYLRISALGFQDYEKPFLLDKNIELEITLMESAEQLEEVEVIAAKNPITNNNGNLKIDVQNPVFSSIPDPLDVLAKLPNVQIAADRESISIVGKGNPLIYMGGQHITFEELTALSVDTIESIELIANPSAKYEAEGRAVLLVTRKRNSGEGVRMNVSETASFRRNFNNYLNANGSYSNGNWTIQGNFAYNDLGQWESHTFAFGIPERDVFSDYIVLIDLNERVETNGGLGFFYPLKGNDYFSFNTTFRRQTNEAPIGTETFIRDNTREDNVTSNSNNDNTKDYFSGNANFNKKIGTDLNLFTGFQYSSYKQTLDTEISNNFNENGFNLDQTRNQLYEINSAAFRLDFTYDFSKNIKWEFGTNLNEAWADAFTDIQEITDNTNTILDFDYKESLYSGYTSLSGNLKKGMDYSLGLRVEYNQVQGLLEAESSPLIERENTNLFPKAGFNVKLDSTKTVSVNYARSVTRPNFSRTSSITVFINPFLEGANNVNLLPTFTNEFSANFQWKNKSINATYYRNTNPVNYTIRYDETLGRAIFSPTNLEKESGFTIGLTLPYSHKKWTSTNTISLNYNKIEDSTATLGSTSPYIYAYSNQQFKIKKDITIAFGGWLLTERQEGIFERNSMLVLDATLTKTFFDKLQCTIRLNDITKAMNFEESYDINGVQAEGVYFVDAQEVAFSIKYDLGNSKKAKFKNRNVDENLERIK